MIHYVLADTNKKLHMSTPLFRQIIPHTVALNARA